MHSRSLEKILDHEEFVPLRKMRSSKIKHTLLTLPTGIQGLLLKSLNKYHIRMLICMEIIIQQLIMVTMIMNLNP